MSAPTPSQVIERVYGMTLFIAFGKLVGASGMMPSTLTPDRIQEMDQKVEKIAGKMLLAGEKNGFMDCLTLAEKKTIVTPFHLLEDQALSAATWRIESLAVLLWALKLVDNIPNYDALAATSVSSVLKIDKFQESRSTAVLQSVSELESARELAELWHWRCRTRQLIEKGEKFPEELAAKSQFKSFDDIVRFTVKGAKETGTAEKLCVVDEDFGVRGKAVRDLSAKEFADVSSLAYERHFALNWLCGRAPENNWDDTPTDT